MTFDSVYEILDNLTTVRKQRFWDWFDGNALRSQYWQTNNVTNTGTFGMSDAAGQGFQIETAAVINSRQSITHNNIFHFDFDASIFLGIFRTVETTFIDMAAGMHGGAGGDIRAGPFAVMQDLASLSFIRYNTRNIAVQSTNTQGTVANKRADFYGYKHELLSASAEFSIEGVLDVTITTTLPDGPLEPAFQMESDTSAVKTMRIRYGEAFNK